ncbi:hypothetical protein FJT64_012830 [Amphibalanus amphitrite]|uniref:Uncharacterized protein n=1 Tax=Amphibalanus amphitrite TaxID=1232801 RepID=A0A6A4VH79_AMPAM|nr:hypothetical protein FJT64_012830 [Amphibalanus amphitrite]
MPSWVRLFGKQTGSLLTAAVDSGFFGVMPVLAWATVTATFVRGRPRYGRLIARLTGVLTDTERLLPSGGRAGPDLPAWGAWFVAIVYTAATIIIGILTLSVAVSYTELRLHADGGDDVYHHPDCSWPSFLVPLKFVFGCQKIAAGLQKIEESLSALLSGREADLRHLERLGQLQTRLSECPPAAD